MKRVWIAVVIAMAAIAPACKGGGGGVEVVAGAPAGDVTEVSGDVHATRDGKTRAIAKGDVVAGDDVIATGDDGRVTIVLRHNQVPWSLGPNKSKKVADSAAWSAAKGASGEAITDDHSTAAGRHAERSATETGASLNAPAPPPAMAAPAAQPAPPPTTEEAPAPAAAAAPEPPPAKVAAEDKADEKKEEAPPPAPAPARKAKAPDDDLLSDGENTIGANQGQLSTRAGGGGGVGGGVAPGAPSASPRGRITIGELSTSGSLSNDDATRAVRGRTGLFRACYQRELQRNPSLAGFLTMTISVGADGAVASSKVDGADDLADVRACIASQIGRMKFAPAKRSSTIKGKMVLAPNG
jgi:hypothetical protein